MWMFTQHMVSVADLCVCPVQFRGKVKPTLLILTCEPWIGANRCPKLCTVQVCPCKVTYFQPWHTCMLFPSWENLHNCGPFPWVNFGLARSRKTKINSLFPVAGRGKEQGQKPWAGRISTSPRHLPSCWIYFPTSTHNCITDPYHQLVEFCLEQISFPPVIAMQCISRNFSLENFLFIHTCFGPKLY